jgi:hypothetical protein
MRIFVMSQPRFPVPPEQLPALMQGFVAWREKYRSVMEAFEFFAGGGGGFGVLNIPDEATLNQIMLEYPFGFFDQLDIRPVLDGDKGLAQFQAAMQAMAAGRPPAG